MTDELSCCYADLEPAAPAVPLAAAAAPARCWASKRPFGVSPYRLVPMQMLLMAAPPVSSDGVLLTPILIVWGSSPADIFCRWSSSYSSC